MTLEEAIAFLGHEADIALTLARAPRTSAYSRSIADKHRTRADAIATVLAAIPDGARCLPPDR
jgi:hypothetical protein